MAIKGQSITITYTVWDTDTAAPKSGDVNNHTCRLSQNGGTFATATNTPADIGYGIYALTLTATETNCDELTLQVSSSTSGVAIPPIQITFDESSTAPSAAAVASAVWNYTSGRTITNTIPSAADIADAVWDEIVFGRTPLVTDSAADILITAAATGTPSSIWNYANRSLTSEVLTRDENYQPIKTLAISSEITTAKDAILTRGNSAWITATGFSTFNPATDTVIINATQAATLVTATGFATPSDLAGLSTFNPSTDTVTINATQAATLAAASDLDSVATKVELIKSKTDNLPTNPATATDVTTAQAAIIAAMPDVTGLSTFDASTDTVTINATQAATMVTATGFATPSDIPTADITAIKTKVDTLNNTDLTGIATAANITTAQNAIINAMPDISGLSTFDAANDTVTINATQAATMVTADVSGLATPSDIPTSDISAIKTKVDSLHNTDLTGIATSANISTAQTAIISHGDENWTGGGEGGGGITAEDVWKYSGTYGRSLTVSPTDISSLATKTDLTTAQTAIVNAMPSTAGLATATNVSDAKADIIAAIPDISGLSTFNAATDTVVIDSTQAATMTTATGFATPANITDAQTAIINAMPDVSGLSTFDPSTDTVILASAQTDAIASSVWSDTTIYTGNSKGNRLSGIYNTVQNIPGQVWMVDADYGATIQGTMGQAIYNMFNDHATATDVSVVADLLEQIDAGVLHWSTTATRLTLYKEDNSVLRVYALERDADGNITRINPVA